MHSDEQAIRDLISTRLSASRAGDIKTVVVTPRDGGAPVRRAGSVLSVLRKQQGRWVIVRDANLLVAVPS